MYKTWNYKNDGCWAATKAAPEGAPPVTAVAEAEEEERQAGEAGPAAGGPRTRGNINVKVRICDQIQWRYHY